MLEISNATFLHTLFGQKKISIAIVFWRSHLTIPQNICWGIPSTNNPERFFGGQVLRIFLHKSFGAHIKKYWSYAPGMALATCEMYLLDEFVKPPFETWPPKLCQTHIWQDIAQNIRSNISFNKSDNIFLSKTILILFVRCFGEKNAKHFGDISPRNLPHESFGLVGYFPKMSQTFLRTLSLCNLVGDISHP